MAMNIAFAVCLRRLLVCFPLHTHSLRRLCNQERTSGMVWKKNIAVSKAVMPNVRQFSNDSLLNFHRCSMPWLLHQGNSYVEEILEETLTTMLAPIMPFHGCSMPWLLHQCNSYVEGLFEEELNAMDAVQRCSMPWLLHQGSSCKQLVFFGGKEEIESMKADLLAERRVEERLWGGPCFCSSAKKPNITQPVGQWMPASTNVIIKEGACRVKVSKWKAGQILRYKRCIVDDCWLHSLPTNSVTAQNADPLWVSCGNYEWCKVVVFHNLSDGSTILSFRSCDVYSFSGRAQQWNQIDIQRNTMTLSGLHLAMADVAVTVLLWLKLKQCRLSCIPWTSSCASRNVGHGCSHGKDYVLSLMVVRSHIWFEVVRNICFYSS